MDRIDQLTPTPCCMYARCLPHLAQTLKGVFSLKQFAKPNPSQQQPVAQLQSQLLQQSQLPQHLLLQSLLLLSLLL